MRRTLLTTATVPLRLGRNGPCHHTWRAGPGVSSWKDAPGTTLIEQGAAPCASDVPMLEEHGDMTGLVRGGSGPAPPFDLSTTPRGRLAQKHQASLFFTQVRINSVPTPKRVRNRRHRSRPRVVLPAPARHRSNATRAFPARHESPDEYDLHLPARPGRT